MIIKPLHYFLCFLFSLFVTSLVVFGYLGAYQGNAEPFGNIAIMSFFFAMLSGAALLGTSTALSDRK